MPNNPEVKGKKPYKKLLIATTGVLLLVVIVLGLDIYTYPRGEVIERADTAIVLGAAVWTDRPSPVFAERLNHAVSLYRENKVKKIIVTGGVGQPKELSESEVGEKYLIEKGVLAVDILKETQSSTTFENLNFSLPIIKENNLSSIFIVSDPLHLRRSVKMARDLGLNAYPAPTPTSRYQGFFSQIKFLLREIYFYIVYLIFGI